MQEFSSSCERILIHQKVTRDTRILERFIPIERDERKIKIFQKHNSIKLRKMRKRKSKIHFIKKKSVFSQVKKNESALERIRGYHGQSSRKYESLSN